jgi:hypothetical protein
VQLPPFVEDVLRSLQALPRAVLFAGVLVPIFLVTVVVSLATSGGEDEDPVLAVNPSATPALSNVDEPATATATVPAATSTPEPTPEPANRADCAAIQGTAYESPEEREWYLANCLGGGQTASGDGGGTSPSGPAVTGGVEYSLGHRMIIPSVGIDASVNGVQVPSSGAMPNPAGYFNFLWYDFAAFGGLGGTLDSGNYVVGCHVDSAVYGLALCYYVRDLGAGASIQVVGADGAVRNYTVVSSTSYSANTDFSGIVSAGAADLTIITCTGTFAGGSYDQRHVVQAVRS